MKKIILLSIILISSIGYAKQVPMERELGLRTAVNKENSNSDRIVLTKKNSLSIRVPITPDTTSIIKQNLIKIGNSLPKSEKVYLFLSTPGGSIIDGLEIINMAKSLSQEVITITSFAASMGYIMVQSLGERLILPNGILMSHRAYGGFEGQIPGEIDSQLKFWHEFLRDIDETVALRSNLTLERYRELTRNEYWTSGKKAIKDRMADKIVSVTCDKSLSGEVKEKMMTFFGPIDVIWSECPLISTPLRIDFTGIENNKSISEIEKRLTKEIISDVLYRKQDVRVIKDLQVSDKYKQILLMK